MRDTAVTNAFKTNNPGMKQPSEKQPSAAVIISTYNQPEWLEKVLWGYEHQTVKDFEIILADDGSGETTQLLIERFMNTSPLHIRHVWQADEGFQKSRILNKAIQTAKADYLIFTDQDCIPREDFVETHLKNARKGHFLSGGYYKLTMPVSLALTMPDIETGRAFDLTWLKQQGQPMSFKATKLFRNPFYARLMNALTPARASWNGCNSSGWRADMLHINGFNEDMQYGGQDREFGERLVNAGLKPIQLRYAVVCLHLDHKRPYKTPATLKKNKAIRQHTRKNRIIQTPNGLRKLAPSA